MDKGIESKAEGQPDTVDKVMRGIERVDRIFFPGLRCQILEGIHLRREGGSVQEMGKARFYLKQREWDVHIMHCQRTW